MCPYGEFQDLLSTTKRMSPGERWALFHRRTLPHDPSAARPSTQHGPALPLPCTTLRIGLVNLLLNPTLLLAAPQEPHRCSRKHQAPASLVFSGFPLNSQPCSAHGIQRRDQGGRFHLIHPQNHHARGKKTHHFQGFSGHCKLAGGRQKHPGQGLGAASQSSSGSNRSRHSVDT